MMDERTSERSPAPLALLPASKVYIACPSTMVTGGTELLHQLCHKLRRRGVRALMHYSPHPAPEGHFAEYETQRAEAVEDGPDNVLVVPEVAAGVRLLREYKRIRKAMWWLSVDNYLKGLTTGTPAIRVGNTLVFRPGQVGLEELRSMDVTHLAQSRYAEEFLRRNGFARIEYLSDYLGGSFIEGAGARAAKRDQVAYNPKKGVAFTLDIKARARDIAFVPLEKMTPDEVAQTLRESKVYIDFGKHPGKDRIPREAALCGCCVITGRSGAAANPEDVPIAEGYKFAAERENIPQIVEKIRACLAEYEQRSRDFEGYREKIRGEERQFEEDVERIFG
jgi:hypothetical protein